MSPPNLVVVICHDLGRRLGCYGIPEARTPNIDAFAAGGVRFSNAFCTAPQCSPSRAALWTGRYPHANGTVGLTHAGFKNDLNPDERHLVQLLAENGYDTHLFGACHEAQTHERCGYRTFHGGGSSSQHADRFVDFIGQRRAEEGPFFAQVGTAEPHRPFNHGDVPVQDHARMTIPPHLPDIPVVREDLADMEASIAFMDREFGRMLEALRASAAAANTLVVFTADHGIPFPRAKMSLYDGGLEVPLIMQGTGLGEPRTLDTMIPNVDVMPTFLELLGLPVPGNLHGRSFAPLLRGEAYTPNAEMFAEKTYHTYYDPMRCIRTGRWKLIANFENAPWCETSPDYGDNAKGYPETSLALNVPYSRQYHPPIELFDLEQDPGEWNDLVDDPAHRKTRDGLIRRLRAWMETTGDPLLDGPMAQGAYRVRMAAFKDV